MGCASSKQKRCRRCRHCQAPYSPVPRSYSMHVVHPPEKKGDSYHVVALTSTTLGSLAVDSHSHSPSNYKDNINAAIDILATEKENENDNANSSVVMGDGQEGIAKEKELKLKLKKSREFSVGLVEAKTWSNMIQEKIPKIVPKTPVWTPPGEPETINAWELMEGLEEDDDTSVHLPHRFRSFSFDISRDPSPVPDSLKMNDRFSPKKPQINHNHKPIWLQLADEDSNSNFKCPEFDPQVISTFRKSLQELSPTHPFYLKPTDSEKQPPHPPSTVVKDFSKGGGGKEKVVVYFTSLRGVRKTYEDCCHVRVILKGLGVRLDERDVSMHSGFKEELRELLGDGFSSGGLPRVFVGGKYIGGAEEIRRMNEDGQLEKVVEGCEMVDDDGGGGGGGACEACGDIRFVPCETCNGSCKIYYEGEGEGEDEDEEQLEEAEEEEEEEGGEYGFQRCPDCNENGLIRCPICCY